MTKWIVGAAVAGLGISQSGHGLLLPPVRQASPLCGTRRSRSSMEQPRQPTFQPIYDRLKKRQVLEELTPFLAPLRLPRKLTVRADESAAPPLVPTSRKGP